MSELVWDIDEIGDLVAHDESLAATVMELFSARGNYWVLRVESGTLTIEAEVDSVEEGKALAAVSVEAIEFWNKRASELLAKKGAAHG